MKKSTLNSVFVLALVICTVTFGLAQNLMINGDLESWTAGSPDGWTNAENISQESTIVHGGSFSARHTSAQSTKDFQQVIDGIQAGQEYTISYWYMDNDPEARTRIWSYWLSGVNTLPDHADILRPSTYSEDNPDWLQFNEVLTAPAAADGFRFEVRVYNQGGLYGGSVFYDDFEFSGDVVINPEPSNYPTNFTATVAGLSINLTWTDAVGPDLPSAYIIMAGINPSLPVPVDGTPVPDDTDLSDGNGALNVPFGNETATFSNLEINTTYYFTIYPYANAGANIDFKTDGTAPTADATTSNITIIESENFDESWGNWTTISVVGDEVWDRNNTYGINGTPCARMSGYSVGPLDNDDWLISPAMNFDDYENEILVFYTAMDYTGPDLECKISTDYDGGNDPYTATWTTLACTMSPGGWEWTESGTIDISAYSGNSVYVAFHYTSGVSAGSATWEVDDIVISGEEDVVINPEPSNYPTNFIANEAGSAIQLSWTDAIGTQLPDKYIIFAGTDASLPVPTDGVPVPDDPDLSDGSAAINIAYGIEEYTFSNLPPSTMYYFSIYPYTNSGVNIDYKNDGTAPTANATTSNVVTVVIEEENFDVSWGNWTTISIIGSQVWDRDNTWGIGDTPCASMTGYEGQPYENDDWLISPALNLDNYENEILVFYNAMSYTGPDLELKISTDYDGGGDPYSATWSTESFTMSTGFFEWTESGEIDLSGYDGNAVYVAFHFTSTDLESATWEIEDIVITGEEEATIAPEPSNYPTDFSADGAGSAIDLTWVDATGIQLPDKYIIFAGTSSSLPTPNDGIPTPDDLDLSDGLGAVNVDYGIEEFTFSNLEPSTTYYFSIYPYTNNGVNIDYKTDGTVPTANATTSNVVTVVIEEENFDVSWGNWTTISVVGSQEWDRDNTWGIGDTPCASMTGYEGQPYENDDWLISPALNLDNYENEILVFYNAMSYTGPDLELKISTDYDGGGDPYSATWSTESFTMSTGFFEWTESGEIDLSGYDGNAVYVAFHFTSTDLESATWEIEDIVITGEEEATIDPEPTNYPTSFNAEASGTSILLSWMDAIGEQLPDRYLIYASTDASLPTPSDGTPVPDDTDLSDGSGALNINYGVEAATFNGLATSTTYYFSIYPYTNSGSNIDYKNDGTAPTANATTEEPVLVVIESENFDESWGNWTTISVVGSQAWDRDNSWGIGGSPCASMTGYEGQAYENDDWLISPALDLDNYNNEILVFQNALGYTGPDLQLKISTDYDGGGDPYSATWSNKSFTMSTGYFEWTESGEIDLSEYNGSAVYVAFQFTSTNSESATWEVDDIEITGEEGMSSDDQFFEDGLFKVYPNPTTGFIYIEKPAEVFNNISIMTATGKLLRSMETNTDYSKIDLTGLSEGFYLIVFHDNETGQTITRKLIVH